MLEEAAYLSDLNILIRKRLVARAKGLKMRGTNDVVLRDEVRPDCMPGSLVAA